MDKLEDGSTFCRLHADALVFRAKGWAVQDSALLWGGDLSASPVGDIALASGDMLSQQRVLRRLLTNALDYIWHPDYGAGLASAVGETVDVAAIRATIRGQIFLEASVARVPEPVIDAVIVGDGSVYVTIRYVTAEDGTTQVLAFNIGA